MKLYENDKLWIHLSDNSRCFTEEKKFDVSKSKSMSMQYGGWSGGAKVLCKLLVPGRPTNLAYSRARAYCACSRCGWGMFGHFFSRLSFLFSFSLSGRRPDID